MALPSWQANLYTPKSEYPGAAAPVGVTGAWNKIDKQFYEMDPEQLAKTNPEMAVRRAYYDWFGREADPEGLKYWTDQLKNGTTYQELSQGFRVSPESGLSQSQFDATQSAVKRMQEGTAPQGMFKYGAESFGSPDTIINGLFATKLGRMPTAEELAQFNQDFKANPNIPGLIGKISRLTPGEGSATVDPLVRHYQKLYGNATGNTTEALQTNNANFNAARAADPAQQQWWVGKSPTALLQAQMQRPEHKAWLAKTNQRNALFARPQQPPTQQAPTQPANTMDQQINALKQPQGLRPLGMFNATNMPKRW